MRSLIGRSLFIGLVATLSFAPVPALAQLQPDLNIYNITIKNDSGKSAWITVYQGSRIEGSYCIAARGHRHMTFSKASSVRAEMMVNDRNCQGTKLGDLRDNVSSKVFDRTITERAGGGSHGITFSW